MKSLLQKHGFSFNKALGQNFLVDPNIVRKTIEAADISKKDVIIEVGPGTGILTKGMAEVARAVVAIEIDGRLLPILAEVLTDYDNVCLINDDALKVGFPTVSEELSKKGLPEGASTFKLVANLPYYITSPLLVHFLSWGHPIDTMVLMVQKEVADRLLAEPGSKKYGSISVLTQYYSRPMLIHRVPKGVFYPPPDVESAIIRLDVYKEPPVKVKSDEIFFGVVRAAFNQRRKTLLNALSGAHSDSPVTGLSREQWKNILGETGIDPARRGETLGLSEFAAIANVLVRVLAEGRLINEFC